MGRKLPRCFQKHHFIGQTNSDQRTARALGAVDQWRRNIRACGHLQKFVPQLASSCDQFVGEWNGDSLFRPDEVQHTVVALEPVFPQHQALSTQLNAFRFVSTFGNIRDFAAFVIHRRGFHPVQFQQIQFGNQTFVRSRQQDGPGMKPRRLGRRWRPRRLGGRWRGETPRRAMAWRVGLRWVSRNRRVRRVASVRRVRRVASVRGWSRLRLRSGHWIRCSGLSPLDSGLFADPACQLADAQTNRSWFRSCRPIRREQIPGSPVAANKQIHSTSGRESGR